MKVRLMGDALLVEPGSNGGEIDANAYDNKAVALELEPAYYVALGKTGLMERSVSLTAEDRKVVAALVGGWVAEGFQPLPCDLKGFAKHVRNLVAASKPAKPESDTPTPAE
jgi:hypothetical protein